MENNSKVTKCIKRRSLSGMTELEIKEHYRVYSVNSARKFRLKHKERIRKKRQAYLLWTKYRLTLEEYHAIKNEQGGACAICREECTVQEQLSVDHCHETDIVRGLLCVKCNASLGLMGNRPERLRSAALYLEVYNEPT